ncbi:hypothetical protein BASA50_009842 [Batrachochytrium salamandrivorans]|uniref:Uncharacterized protein n=1 Tax=Batrachochytrium salamandrivorans TaxID=1357716 RepID=A0ABQ8F0Q3_9FUNG|nr:hypothetical protein BASA50_009842 [Batrachochytrium salamandrivorans]
MLGNLSSSAFPKKSNTSSTLLLSKKAATRILSDHSVLITQTDNMKLISFAVVSLLAITVSAYPPQTTTTNDVQSSQSTSTQDMQPSQSTSTDDMQQPYQDRVQAEMGRLTAVCKEKEDFLIQADSDSQTGHYQVLQFEDMVDKLHDELKRIDISSDEESELKQKYHDARMKLAEAMPEYKKQQQLYKKAAEDYNDAEAELQLLENNYKLLTEYNSKHEVQVEPSPNFLYNLDILTKQSDRYSQRD